MALDLGNPSNLQFPQMPAKTPVPTNVPNPFSSIGNAIGGFFGNAINSIKNTKPSNPVSGLPNPFGDTSTGIIGKINGATGLGVNAKAPTPAPVSNTLPKTQVNTAPKNPTTSSTENGTTGGSNLGVLSQQHALNVANAKTPGYVPLKEDGILGPLTKSAIEKYGSGNSNSTTPTTTTTTPTTPTPPSNPDFSGAIAALLKDAEANQAYGKYAQNIGTEAQRKIEDINTNAAATEGGYLSGTNSSSRAQGIAQNVANTASNTIQGITSAENAALAGNAQGLTGQAQTQAAQQAAGALAAPNGNILQINPETGLPVSGLTLPQLAALQGTLQGTTSGAASVAAAGGNIEAQNKTALGTAATGANAKSIGDFQNTINITQKSIDTLHNLQIPLVPNIASTGFNPTSSPIGNDTFHKYFTEKNPAAASGIIQGLNEMKNQISNVIASSTGLTPTGVTNVVNDVDLTTLNPQQLNDFLQYIDKYAQGNMSAAQDNIKRIQSGEAPDANNGVLPVPQANSTGQAALGTGASLASGLLGKIISEAGNAVAGVAGGIAAKILQ